MRLAVAHMQIHQLSPGFGALQILELQFHLCCRVRSQKLCPSASQLRAVHDSGSSTSLAHTRWVLSWIHLKSPYLAPENILDKFFFNDGQLPSPGQTEIRGFTWHSTDPRKRAKTAARCLNFNMATSGSELSCQCSISPFSTCDL